MSYNGESDNEEGYETPEEDTDNTSSTPVGQINSLQNIVNNGPPPIHRTTQYRDYDFNDFGGNGDSDDESRNSDNEEDGFNRYFAIFFSTNNNVDSDLESESEDDVSYDSDSDYSSEPEDGNESDNDNDFSFNFF